MDGNYGFSEPYIFGEIEKGGGKQKTSPLSSCDDSRGEVLIRRHFHLWRAGVSDVMQSVYDKLGID